MARTVKCSGRPVDSASSGGREILQRSRNYKIRIRRMYMAIKGRDQKAILKRLQNEIIRAGLDALLLTSAGSVFYATGFAVRSLYRSGKTGNAAAVVTAAGEVYLVCSEFEKNAAVKTCDPSIHIESYPVWIYIEDYAVENMVKEVQPDLNKTYRMAAQFIPERTDGAKIGVENKWLTWEAGNFLRETFGADHIVDCSKVLNEARAIKTPWEIEVLRHNAKIAEQAMNTTAKQIVPGYDNCGCTSHIS